MQGNTVKISSCTRSRKLFQRFRTTKSLFRTIEMGRRSKAQQAGRPIIHGFTIRSFREKKLRKFWHLRFIQTRQLRIF